MYIQLAESRLNNEDYILLETESGQFGFTCRTNYLGLMAQPSRTGKNRGRVAREKQGLYDLYIVTGNRYGDRGVTHRNILQDVTKYSSLENCYSVWRGEHPQTVTKNENEQEVLAVLMLLFFEQEINWGKENWQRYTYFAPKIRTPKRLRPRDMLMGYVCQAFDLGVDNIAYWMNSRPTTTTFIAPDKSNYGFEDYNQDYKSYFTQLENDSTAEAVMTGEILKKYRADAMSKANNSHFQEE